MLSYVKSARIQGRNTITINCNSKSSGYDFRIPDLMDIGYETRGVVEIDSIFCIFIKPKRKGKIKYFPLMDVLALIEKDLWRMDWASRRKIKSWVLDK